MECEVCGRQIDSSHEKELCHICLELVELEEKRAEVTEERVKRNCLSCDRTFWALGKFNRICPRCAEKNRKVADVDRYGVRLMEYERKSDQRDPVVVAQLDFT